MLYDAIQQVLPHPPSVWRRQLKVNFRHEAGEDEGGVRRPPPLRLARRAAAPMLAGSPPMLNGPLARARR